MSKATILIPLDASQLSRTILPYVRQIFAPEAFSLYFLKVITRSVQELEEIVIPPSYAAREWTPHMYETVEQWRNEKHESIEHKQEALLRAVEGSLRTETAPLVDAGYDVRVAAAMGEPLASIEAVIQAEAIFAVAMTTHAREGFDRLLHGSIAGKLLHDYDIPMLLYHPSRRHHSDEE